ncbi:hypothetical protein [Lederbergia galactosidilytica]|uniref:DUF2283 domain-containing protein n=1 Tax=Lederbergia galactosidilytica TaxID=217031 RepID=A0A177ZQH6_9BACI|nr:hypothetical protein [Lederbergia galactosidilytica]OAK70105.1 hypothetical protein ABB05_13085 [Lederbergia galactosidilytica]
MTRVKIQENQIKYDKRHDVLHVFFYPDFMTIDDEEYPGVLVRRSIKDEETITGLTILDFTKMQSKDILPSILPQYDFDEIAIH